MDDLARQDAASRSHAAGGRRRLPRLARWGLILAACVALYALLGFFGVPWLIRSQLPGVIEDRTTGAGSVAEVRFNPFTFALELRDFELHREARPPLLRFAELAVDLGFWRSLGGTLEFESIVLAEPYLRIAIDRKGRLNLAETFPRKGEAATALPFHIGRLTVERGRLAFEDLSRAAPIRRTLFPVGLELTDFSLRAEGGPASYRLAAATDSGATLALEGQGSASPLRAEGRLQLKNLPVATLAEFAPDPLGFTVASGALGVDARYRAASGPAQVVEVWDGRLALDGLRLADRDSGRVRVEIPSAKILGLAAHTGGRMLEIRAVDSADGRLDAVRTPQGRLNLADWLPKAGPGNGTPNGSRGPDGPAWSVAIGSVTLDRYAVAFEDRSVPEPATLNFSPLRLELKDYRTGGGEPLQVALNSGVNESGRLGLDGTVGPDARSAELAVDLDGLDLPRFQPYLNRFARLDLVKGTLDVQGRVSFRQDATQPPVLGYRGDARLAGVEARLPGQDQPLASWDELAFSGLDFQSEPARLRIADMAANKLYTRIVVRPDRTLNLAQALIDSPPEKSRDAAGSQPRPSSKGPGGTPLPVAVDVIRLENSQADFSDQSIEPHFSIGIQDLHGTIQGLNSKPGQSAELRLEGQVDTYAPVRIEGKLNLFSPAQFADIHMRFANIDMTTLSPYSGKFAGYKIRMGKMSLDLDYRLRNRRLDSANRIVLTRLELGEPVPGSKAPDLPLHLAIALLKDSQGRIDLNLPIRGNLNDPKVSLPGLVGKVLRGAIRKVVAAPFAALARLAGVGEEELRYVGFNPGEADLGTEQAAQLSKLGKALRERPGLYLQVTGVAGPERDREALVEQDLIDRLKIAKLMDENRPVDAASLRATVLSRSEYERYLAQLYRRETGRASEPSVEAMKRTLLDPGAVTGTRLRVLAQERTAAIRDYLIRSEGLKPERIFQGDVRVERGEGLRVRSELGLRDS